MSTVKKIINIITTLVIIITVLLVMTVGKLSIYTVAVVTIVARKMLSKR